jgi:hypothetical protein
MAVKIQVKFFWVVMPCSVVLGYQCFRHPCCLHLQGKVAVNGDKEHRYRPGVQESGRWCYPIQVGSE